MNETEQRLLEIRLQCAELELERLRKPVEANSGRFRADHPLVLAIVGAIGTALLALINNAWQYKSDRETERLKLESSLILKAIDAPTAAERKQALVFLVDAGLIRNDAGRLRNFPEERIPRVRSSSVSSEPDVKTPAPETR